MIYTADDTHIQHETSKGGRTLWSYKMIIHNQCIKPSSSSQIKRKFRTIKRINNILFIKATTITSSLKTNLSHLEEVLSVEKFKKS